VGAGAQSEANKKLKGVTLDVIALVDSLSDMAGFFPAALRKEGMEEAAPKVPHSRVARLVLRQRAGREAPKASCRQ